jgi:hypothetical protein
MTTDAARSAMRACVELKVRGLQVYQRWKTAVGPAASGPSAARVGQVGAPATAGALSQKENGIMRGALVVAALLGGAAAGKMLYDGFAKKKSVPALPPPSPLQAMFPAGIPGVPGIPAMPTLHAMPAFGGGPTVQVPLSAITPHLYPPHLYPPGYVPPLAARGEQYGDLDDE